MHSDTGYYYPHHYLCFASLVVLSSYSLFCQSVKPAILLLLTPACDMIAEGEAKERSEDHQLPSPATWAWQVPLGALILRSFRHQALLPCIEVQEDNYFLQSRFSEMGH